MARVRNNLYEGLTTASSPKYGFFNNWREADLIKDRVNRLKDLEDYKAKLDIAEQSDNSRASLAESEQLRDLNISSGHIPMEDEIEGWRVPAVALDPSITTDKNVGGLSRDPYTRSAIRQAQSDSAPMLSTANSAVASLGAAPTVGGIVSAQGKLDLSTIARNLARVQGGPTGGALADNDWNKLDTEGFETTVNRNIAQEKLRQGQPAADVRADVADARVRSTVAPGRAARQLAENEEATEGSTWRSVYKMPELSAENSSLRAKDSNRYTTLKLGLGGPEAEAKADVAKSTLDEQNSRENTLSLENSAKVENLKGELAVKLAELGLSTAEQNLMKAEIINHMTGKPTSNPAALQFIEQNPELTRIMTENELGAYRPGYRTTTTGTSFGDGAGARPKTAKEIENEKILMDFFAP